MLRYVVIKAEESIAGGMDQRTALWNWPSTPGFEGGIENYDL